MYNPTKPYKKQVLNLIKQTWETPYISVNNGIVTKKFTHREYHHADGIGTKGIYHWKKRSFKNAIIDALAMNLNDLAMVGAIPYAIVDHILLPKDDTRAVLELIRYLVRECKKREITIAGGETAIHSNIEGLELSITMLGFIKTPKPNRFKVGDILIGIKSNGLHSNGFTKVRELFGDKVRPGFTKPTAIYLDAILALDEKYDIHGMMHITGGAFTKLKDLLNGADAKIHKNHRLKPQEIFKEIYKKGVSDEEMYKTFNCGVGFVLSVTPKDADKIIAELDTKFQADIIGEVVHGAGKVTIESMFSNKKVEF